MQKKCKRRAKSYEMLKKYKRLGKAKKFKRNANELQQPIVMGTLPGYAGEIADTTKGFCDPSGTYPQTKWASGTNLCYLGIEVDHRTDRVIIMSAIDNLIKGQAGQGIQCMNLMMGWEETLGLPQLSFYP